MVIVKMSLYDLSFDKIIMQITQLSLTKQEILSSDIWKCNNIYIIRWLISFYGITYDDIYKHQIYHYLFKSESLCIYLLMNDMFPELIQYNLQYFVLCTAVWRMSVINLLNWLYTTINWSNVEYSHILRVIRIAYDNNNDIVAKWYEQHFNIYDKTNESYLVKHREFSDNNFDTYSEYKSVVAGLRDVNNTYSTQNYIAIKIYPASNDKMLKWICTMFNTKPHMQYRGADSTIFTYDTTSKNQHKIVDYVNKTFNVHLDWTYDKVGYLHVSIS